MPVYFIRAGENGPIKIGYTATPDVKGRLSALRVASPVPIQLVAVIDGTMANEKELHARFARSRLGGEWFQSSSDLEKLIAENAVQDPTLKSLEIRFAYPERIGTMTELVLQGIRHWIRTSGLSQRAIARLAGIDSRTLRDFEADDWNPTAETMRRLDEAKSKAPHREGAAA